MVKHVGSEGFPADAAADVVVPLEDPVSFSHARLFSLVWVSAEKMALQSLPWWVC